MEDIVAKTNEMVAKIAEKLVEITSHAGFTYWKGSEFRKMVDFDEISQTEQDRIFNELIVSGLILTMMGIDEIVSDPDLDKAKKILFSKVRDAIPEGYTNTLKNLGVERKFIRIWKKLIDMREKEYFRDLSLAKNEAMTWEEFQEYPEVKDAWARIETLAIGTLQHVRRGNTNPKDPLWRNLRFFLLSLEKDLRQLFSAWLKLDV